MWTEGTIACPATRNTYKYWAKVYDEGSEHGIGSSRVSKLTIRKTDCTADVFNFDRGVDVPPANAEVEMVLALILEKFS
jgi:hypothetical protein